MKIKNIAITLICFFFGCSPSIIRQGYRYDYDKAEEKCEVRFEKNAVLDSQTQKVVGTVNVKGKGKLYWICDEGEVLKILKQEAWAAGANVINIIEEKMPDSLNDCYQASAQLILQSGNIPIESGMKGEKDTSVVASKIETDKNINADSIYNAKIANKNNTKAILSVVGVLLSITTIIVNVIIFQNRQNEI